MKQVILALLLLIAVVIGGMFVTSAAVKKTDVTLDKDSDLSLLSKGIKWTPDGHITYVTFANGSRRFFLSGNQRTYTIDSSTSLSLDKVLAKNPTINENFGPNKSVLYRNYYATINSVVQTDPKNLNHLLAFTQYEEQALKNGTNDYGTFTSSIGLLESYDGGNTWKDFGPVIKGDDYLSPGIKITGAGEPSAIIKDGYVYVYFVDWAAGVKVSHTDEIFLARTKIFPDGGLGAFEYLTGNGFKNSIENLTPVIKPANENEKFASLPSISYNQYLGQYLAVYETDLGFYQAVSRDGTNWFNQRQIIGFVKPISQRQSGDAWFSYPTLLSDNSQNSDATSDTSGSLYYGQGVWPNTAHELSVKPFELK